MESLFVAIVASKWWREFEWICTLFLFPLNYDVIGILEEKDVAKEFRCLPKLLEIYKESSFRGLIMFNFLPFYYC